MSQSYEKTLKLIEQLKKNNPKTYEFFESLLYGTWKDKTDNNSNNDAYSHLRHYNFFSKRSSQCVVYLNQNHIELLTCVDKHMTGVRKYFNMKKLELTQVHSEYEMEEGLQKDKYLIIKQKQEEIILLFPTSQSRTAFKENLLALQTVIQEIPDMFDPLILTAFIKADTNQNDEINWQELKYLVRLMKIDLNEDMKTFIRKILKKGKTEKIFFNEFERLWKIFYCRGELGEVFQKYNKEQFLTFDEYLAPKLDIKEFKTFLIEEQRQTEQSAKFIKQILFSSNKTHISFYQFCHYIFSVHNNLLSPSYKYYQMSQKKPLNHYHCYSSHNTYLTGNQLTSSSRVERYLIDLQNGIRCVEIDVHDGSNQPIVKHGYTLTSPVTFKDVIITINRFTELNPKHTPIIISLQNHCNQENQIKMAQILTSVFSSRIIRINIYQKTFPTLEECMGKIVIKGPGNYELFLKANDHSESVLEAICDDDQQSDEEKFDELPKQIEQSFNKLQKTFIYNYKQFKQKECPDMQKQKILCKDIQNYQRQKNKASKLQSSQKKLGEDVIGAIVKKSTHSYHNKFKISSKLLQVISMLSKATLNNEIGCHWESISFSEKKIMGFYQNDREINEIRNKSDKKWFRSYPGGLRFNSSNYNPLPAIQMGIQIIALNTQKEDDPNSLILKTFFMKGINQTTGYRLKMPISKQSNQNITKYEIKFISGLRIYENQDDFGVIPSVQIKAYFTGSKRDNELNEEWLDPQTTLTEVVEGNSFNPKFEKSKTIFIKSKDPQIGFLVVEVPDCGRSVIPLQCMKHGWRVISLYQQELKEKESKLLCHVKIIKESKQN